MTLSIGQPQQRGIDLVLEGLGSGISSGIQQKLEQFNKLNQEKKEGEKLSRLGLSPEIASLDPALQKEYFKQLQSQRLLDQIMGGGMRDEPRGGPRSQGSEGDIEEFDEQTLTESPQGQLSDQQIQALSVVNPALGKVAQSQKKQYYDEQQQNRKRNLEIYDEQKSLLRGLEEEDKGLSQLQKLSDKIGKEQGQEFYERIGRTFRFKPDGSLTRIGSATSTPEEERYIKLIADQTKNIKNDFGARVTNLDIEVFLRRFPNLLQTPEGRKQIFETLRDYNQAKQLYAKEYKNLIQKSQGKINPFELEERVEKNIAPQLKKIREDIDSRGFGKEEIKEGSRAFDPQGKPHVFKNGEWIAE